jgi:hypothetical protein
VRRAGGATKILPTQSLILLDIIFVYEIAADSAVRYYLEARANHTEGV